MVKFQKYNVNKNKILKIFKTLLFKVKLLHNKGN